MSAAFLLCLSQSLIDSVIHLSETKWITFPSLCKMLLKRYFATPPKLAERSLWRWRKKVASMIWTSISSGVITSADFGVLHIIQLTWLKYKETGVKWYFTIWAISTTCIKCSQTNHTLSIILFLSFCSKWANEISFCFLIGFSKYRDFCEHFSINVFRSFSPFLNISNKKIWVESIAADSVPVLQSLSGSRFDSLFLASLL